eukprot:gene6452-6950_t
MGNDLDVCSKDDELMKMYEEQYGPKNESVFQLVYRTYNKFCDTLIHPPPINYGPDDLKPKFSNELDNNLWKIREFDLLSLSNRIHCCYWRYEGPPDPDPQKNSDSSDKNRLCIIYLPTNQRALNEAVEVLPLAKQLKCDVFSFDYAGCGKSDGSMHEKIDVDIENVVNYLQATVGENSMSMIFWARGMSTALVIMLLSRLTKQQLQYHKWKVESIKAAATVSTEVTPKKSRWPFSRKSTTTPKTPATPAEFATPDSLFPGLSTEEIEQDIKQRLQILQFTKCVILDSPFISVEDMIRNGIEKMHSKGYYVTKSIIYFVIKMIMKNIAKRLNGFNVFSIKPIELISSINYFPCCILSADNDDYIPIQHGEKLAKLWKNDHFQVKGKKEEEGEGGKSPPLLSSIYGNIQYSIIQGRHFTRRSEETIESTYDFINSHVKYFTNHRFDNLDSILELEQQLKEQEAKFRQEKSKSVDNESTMSLQELEQEVIQELQNALDSIGSSSANAAVERKEDLLEEMAEAEKYFQDDASMTARESDTVELIDIDQFEESNNEEIQATPQVNDEQVSTQLPTRSFSLTHLPQPVFDSQALKWSQNDAMAIIRSDDKQERNMKEE